MSVQRVTKELPREKLWLSLGTPNPFSLSISFEGSECVTLYCFDLKLESGRTEMRMTGTRDRLNLRSRTDTPTLLLDLRPPSN